MSNDTIIGKYCYIGKNVYITKAQIGNYTSIANNVLIGQGEHDYNKISTSSLFYNDEYEELTKESCIVGNDVWIGAGVIVLRGVTIGDGAVIGASAVVTKDIPPYSVACGVPARVIKKRFSDEFQNVVKASKWWCDDIDLARKKIEELKTNE
ncbi:CatB-related O-acetyltransferase [Photobacterium leiognathi]|uniref:CatB-related O-acetyltransferase n=1 Tax=Photobacterium leiognathi TaxID=553611 RepID=UPI002982110D|nr:CatB-related O-acetyltransferase [Photobacterium leiognathi]